MHEPSSVNLGDANALLARSRDHFEQFREQIDPNILLRITERRDSLSGKWCGFLEVNSESLKTAKLSFADCVNNLTSALDHVVAAIAMANGHDRLWDLKYPSVPKDDNFRDAIFKWTKYLGPEMCKVIADTHTTQSQDVRFVKAVKDASNVSKHWSLMISSATVDAIAWQTPSATHQQIVDIPPDAFTGAGVFEFYRGIEPLPKGPMTIVVGVIVDGLGDNNHPDIILSGAIRYVEGVIAAVSQATS